MEGDPPAGAWWTRSRSAGPRGRTWPPTPGCSTACASSSRRPRQARARKYDAGRFSFNVAKGRCETCEGEGFVMVELLFLPSVYAPCPTCHGSRYNAQTLEVRYRGKNIAEVLAMTVDEAWTFFADEPARAPVARRAAERGGRATCGSASRRRSSRAARRSGSSSRPSCSGPPAGDTLYVLDEPTTGLHPADVEKLVAQLDGLVDAGNTVIVVEHDMRRRGAERLGDRRGARRGRRGRAGGRGRSAGRRGGGRRQPDGGLSGAVSGG